MTIQLIEGFDLYSGASSGGNFPMINNGWTVPSATMVTGRFGGLAASMGAGNTSMSKSLPAALATFSMGVAVFVTAVPTATANLLAFRAVGAPQCSLQIDNAGVLTALRGATVLGTSATNLLTLNAWHYLECEIVISATVGVFKVYVDGINVLSVTGANTKNVGTSTGVDTIYFHNIANTSFAANYDDYYVTDAGTRLGEQRVETIRANANTAQDDWAKLTGTSAFAMVGDTTIDGDTTYIFDGTVGHKTTQGLADLAVAPNAIAAVQVSFTAKKDDATTRQVRNYNVSGATTTNGATRNMAASYTKFDDIYATDPNTGVAWTSAAVNALQAGVEVIT